MTHRVGPNGELVIPKHLRDRTGLRPGAEVEFALDGDRLVVTAGRARSPLGGRFAGSGMAERLLEDRANERR